MFFVTVSSLEERDDVCTLFEVPVSASARLCIRASLHKKSARPCGRVVHLFGLKMLWFLESTCDIMFVGCKKTCRTGHVSALQEDEQQTFFFVVFAVRF